MKSGVGLEEPLEPCPDGYAENHVWLLTPRRIILIDWDEDVARYNERVSESSDYEAFEYEDECGLVQEACPVCQMSHDLMVAGRWQGPATIICPSCGFRQMPEAGSHFDRFFRQLLQRLILADADPGYEARRLLVKVAQLRAKREEYRDSTVYPVDKMAAKLTADFDLDAVRLDTVLLEGLGTRLPDRRPGVMVELILLECALALEDEFVRASPDAALLMAEVRGYLLDVRADAEARTAEA